MCLSVCVPKLTKEDVGKLLGYVRMKMENALVNDTVNNTWKTDSAEKWNTLKTALVHAAKTIVGFEKLRLV